MKELTVKIKYNNDIADFTAFDVHCALTNLFGINTDFQVEESAPQEREKDKKDLECFLNN